MASQPTDGKTVFIAGRERESWHAYEECRYVPDGGRKIQYKYIKNHLEPCQHCTAEDYSPEAKSYPEKILQVLQNAPEPMTMAEIHAHTGIGKKSLTSALYRLERDGEIGAEDGDDGFKRYYVGGEDE